MKHREYKLQVAIVKALRTKGWVVFSIPNERGFGVADAIRMRASGLTKGAPDLICWSPSARCWWLELKTPEGKRSPEQECMEEVANSLFINYMVVRDIKDIERME